MRFNIKNNYYFSTLIIVLIKNKKLFISLFCAFLAALTFFLYLMPAYIYPKLTVRSYISLSQINSIEVLFQNNKEIINNLNMDISDLPNNFLGQEIITKYLLTKFTKKEFNDFNVNKNFALFFDKKNNVLEVKSIFIGWKASVEFNDFFSKAIISYLNSEAEKTYVETVGIVENEIILLEDSKNKYEEEAKDEISLEKINQIKENIKEIVLEINEISKIKDSLILNKNLIVNRFNTSKVDILKEQYMSLGKYIFIIIFGSVLFSIFMTFLINYYKNNIFDKRK